MLKHESDAREILKGLITLLGASCSFDLGAPEDEIARLVLTALGQPSAETTSDLAGLHFDPGDLVEAF